MRIKNKKIIKQAHVVIIGASGHARVIADIIRCSGDVVEGFLDDREAIEFPGLKVLGKVADVEEIARKNISFLFVIGIGQNDIRHSIADEHPCIPYYTAIHPSAVVSIDVEIGPGTVVMPNAVVNTGTKIEKHCIINTGATVDHDCLIGSFAHLSPGVHLSGMVRIGEGTWLGVGASVVNNLCICGNCIIGAGAIVISDLDTKGTYVGVPAKKIKFLENEGNR